jgi:branched-chain amino acid transport system permease protein
VFRYKILAFFIGCFLAGIAGSLWANYCRVISPDDFTLTKAIWLVGMLIVGGMGSTVGAIIGTIFIQILNELITFAGPTLITIFPELGVNSVAAWLQIGFGLVVILFLVFEPRGLAHRWEILKSSYRLWPFSY